MGAKRTSVGFLGWVSMSDRHSSRPGSADNINCLHRFPVCAARHNPAANRQSPDRCRVAGIPAIVASRSGWRAHSDCLLRRWPDPDTGNSGVAHEAATAACREIRWSRGGAGNRRCVTRSDCTCRRSESVPGNCVSPHRSVRSCPDRATGGRHASRIVAVGA